MLELLIPDATDWLSRTYAFVGRLGLRAGTENLAWALAFLFFMLGITRATYFGSVTELAAVFGRLFLVLALLTGTSGVQTFMQDTWRNAYGWSSSVWAEDLDGKLLEASAKASLLVAPFTAITGVVGIGLKHAAATTAKAGFKKVAAQGAMSTTGRAAGYLNGIMFLLAPMLGFYSILIYASGLLVLLAHLFFPLCAAALLLPGGVSWLSKLAGAFVAAVFTVILLPLIFSIAIDLGLVLPLERMAETWQKTVELWNGGVAALRPPSGWETLNPAKMWDWFNGLGESWKLIGSVANFVMGWLLSVLAVIVGMLAGAYLLLNAERYVGMFIGVFGRTGGIPGVRGGRGTSGYYHPSPQTSAPSPGAAPTQIGGGSHATASRALDPSEVSASGRTSLPPQGGVRP